MSPVFLSLRDAAGVMFRFNFPTRRIQGTQSVTSGEVLNCLFLVTSYDLKAGITDSGTHVRPLKVMSSMTFEKKPGEPSKGSL